MRCLLHAETLHAQAARSHDNQARCRLRLGQGPRYLKLGQTVRYDPDDLEAFVQAVPRTSTSERSSGQAGKPSRV